MLPYISIYFMDKDCIYPFISFKIPWVLSLPLSTLELHVPCLRAVESTWRAGCLSSQRVYHFEDFSFNKKNKQRIYNLIELSSDIQIKNSMCVYIYTYLGTLFCFFEVWKPSLWNQSQSGHPGADSCRHGRLRCHQPQQPCWWKFGGKQL